MRIVNTKTLSWSLFTLATTLPTHGLVAETPAIADELGKIQVNPLPQFNEKATPVALSPNTEPSETLLEFSQRLREAVHEVQTQSTASNSLRRAKKQVLRKTASTDGLTLHRRANGTAMFIRGEVLEPAASSNLRSKGARELETAQNFLRLNRTLLGLTEPDEELRLMRQFTDNLGYTHLRFSQKYKGLQMWPAELTVHLDAQGNVNLMNGAFVPTPRRPLGTKPYISVEQATATAKQALFATNSPVKSELIFYAPLDKPVKLAWKLELDTTPSEHWIVVVDALTGKILTQFDQVNHAAATVEAQDMSDNTVTLNVWEENGTFGLQDTSKSMFDETDMTGTIEIFDLANQSYNEAALMPILFTDPSEIPPEAVSLAANLSTVYDYYLERHDHNSIDGQGMTIRGVVRMGGVDAEGAFYSQASNIMVFGSAQPYAGSLDVVGHEFQHGVGNYTANMLYKNQSGALKEALSDIFGEMVEAYKMGATDWTTGTALMEGHHRSLNDPASLLISGTDISYPQTMSEYIDTSIDNGGVHFNNTIVSHAFYLLAEGLDGAIGIADAERIFFRALSVHLVRNSQFIDMRLSAIAAADELFGQDSTQSQKVAEAFDTVEIFDGPPTPPPMSLAPINGIDATLFVCFNPAINGYVICRRETGLGDDDIGIFLSDETTSLANRLSVTRDGWIASFVTTRHDFCFISTLTGTESCLDRHGEIFSASMSPDGQRFGFIFQNSLGKPSNRIAVLDLNDGELCSDWCDFELVAPTDDPTVFTDTIANAYNIAFTLDGQSLIYDALNIIPLSDGTNIANWSIYMLNLPTGQIFNLIPPIEGVDIASPGLSRNSDNFMTYSATLDDTSLSLIFAMNLNTSERGLVGVAAGAFSTASYTGDDSAIIFDTRDSNTPSGFSLLYRPLSGDYITSAGDTSLWLQDACCGVIYRRELDFTPPTDADKTDQTITFDPIADKTVSDEDFTVNVSTSSGLPVTLSAEGTCSLMENTVHLEGIGICTIIASQAGDDEYNPAPDVAQSFAITEAEPPEVIKSEQTITFDSLANKTLGDPDFVISATASSDLPVIFTAEGTCSIDGSTVSLLGEGTCTITASQVGDDEYNPASDVIQSFTITKAEPPEVIKSEQTITFEPLIDKTLGDPNFTLSATASSDLPVSFTAEGTCSIEGSTVSLLGEGTCTITASQAGDDHYSPATEVVQSFEIIFLLPAPVELSCPTEEQQEQGLNEMCNADGKTVNDLTIHTNGTLANAVVAGNVTNHGWLGGNVTIAQGGQASNGVLTGHIVNHGTLSDFQMRGNLLEGGTFTGDNTVASRVPCEIRDVQLAPNATLQTLNDYPKANLAGTISGDPEAPAQLDKLKILSGTKLSHVVLGPDVELSPEAILGEGVILNGESVSDIDLPALGNAEAFTAQGKPATTETTFSAGVSVNDGVFQNHNIAEAIADQVEIRGQIQVDETHVGQTADIFVTIAYRITEDSETVYLFTVNHLGGLMPWEGELTSLQENVFRTDEVLKTLHDVKVYDGLLLSSGVLEIRFGYVLADGTVVRSEESIALTTE